jgi:DNA replication ATP-dependent helicase Dna2
MFEQFRWFQMHIGSAVHEILQTVMRKNLTRLPDIQQVADEFLQSRDTLHLLFLCQMTQNDLKSLMDPFVTQIHEFMLRHIVQNNSEIHISKVHDIEENVWCPRLGLKGKIDVTVTANSKLTPLEIKTGKASFSLEHKGQLILYQMMLRDLGKEIDGGLLLYIKEGIMKEVKSTLPEQRGLIQLRNRLAFHLKDGLNFPEPINHRSACSRCEYNTVCCSFLAGDQLDPGHNLLEVKSRVSAHLSAAHVEYFHHWCDIITAEHTEAQKSVKLRHIWTKSPEVRAAKGNALINLKIQEVFENGDEFLTIFTGEVSGNFEGGEYLIVSTGKRCSVAAGRVVTVGESMITLMLSCDLSKQYSEEVFHLDRYESQSQSVFNYSNMGALLEPRAEKLRRIIIDREPAVFQKTMR